MQGTKPLEQDGDSGFRLLPLVAFVGVLLVGISLWANLYRNEVSLPRYCDDPAHTLLLLERVITAPRPAGDAARRPYLIAAKLLYLSPRRADEPVDDYLARIAAKLEEVCR